MKSIFKIYTFFLILSVSLSACKQGKKTEIKTTSISFEKEGELQIYKRDSLLANINIEIAETDYETQTGLMYRESMQEKQGMLFIFLDVAMHSFYMKNTEIPLDLIFIDENQHIASFQENAQPFNEEGLSSQVPIKYVLEVNAGLAEKWLLEVGDRVVFTRD